MHLWSKQIALRITAVRDNSRTVNNFLMILFFFYPYHIKHTQMRQTLIIIGFWGYWWLYGSHLGTRQLSIWHTFALSLQKIQNKHLHGHLYGTLWSFTAVPSPLWHFLVSTAVPWIKANNRLSHLPGSVPPGIKSKTGVVGAMCQLHKRSSDWTNHWNGLI